MSDKPIVTFNKVPRFDEKTKSRVLMWEVRINLPNGDYHAGEASTPQAALLLAASHWARYEATKNEESK